MRIRTAIGLGVLAAVLLLQSGVPSRAADLSDEARERSEVRAIFRLLVEKVSPGDGWSFDLPCVFPETWETFWTDEKTLDLRPLIGVREALDPHDAQRERFCDLAERNRRAQAMAKTLPAGENRGVNTADTRFSYPNFDRTLSSAEVISIGQNDRWFADGSRDFVASGTIVRLAKVKGNWEVRSVEVMWIAN